MAEIAHPYQETAAADERAATQRRPRRVSFSELVEAWAFARGHAYRFGGDE